MEALGQPAAQWKIAVAASAIYSLAAEILKMQKMTMWICIRIQWETQQTDCNSL